MTFLARILVVFTVLSSLTRIILVINSLHLAQLSPGNGQILKIFAFGVINDLVTFCYLASPVVLIHYLGSFFIPARLGHIIGKVFLFVLIGSLCFNAVAEYLFWDEFASRYNFIAVDYLVYTDEVIGNIVESYPMHILLSCIFAVSVILFSIFSNFFKGTAPLQRALSNFIIIPFALTSFFFYNHESLHIKEDRYANELSQNGIYNLFSAFRNNHLKYENFYTTISNEEAFKKVRSALSSPSASYTNSNIFNLTRHINSNEAAKNYNVILLSVESLSAEFLATFGGETTLTPVLNQLAQKSVLFSHYYATGNRTVRGLEAMTLSVPPTPGSSIVRRPGNENLFSIATILNQHHYDSKFLYGGFGYFDNMNHFFSSNGFQVIDRNLIENTTFANIWGVCDEDLYRQVIKEADKSHQRNKPFFSLVMTTSNHRPYTYPEGKVAIPSGTNRKGAVQYTDYAIGELLKAARTKPWFDKTIFVITADHCASSAGKTSLPVSGYHIPLLIYAPKIMKPQPIDALSSQIDLAPTILGLLNVSYDSRFFGTDILKAPKERAFIATYQQLGFMKDGKLIVLSPNRKNSQASIKEHNHLEAEVIDSNLLHEAISYYQATDYLFTHGLMQQ